MGARLAKLIATNIATNIPVIPILNRKIFLDKLEGVGGFIGGSALLDDESIVGVRFFRGSGTGCMYQGRRDGVKDIEFGSFSISDCVP